jgi:hypothetical protein
MVGREAVIAAEGGPFADCETLEDLERPTE